MWYLKPALREPRLEATLRPPPLLVRAWRAKVAATAAILGYYLAGYFALNRMPFETYHGVPAVPFLDDLPLIPWTVVVYNSVFLLGGLGIWLLPDARAAGRHVTATIIAFTINYVAFAAYPTRIDRPPLPESSSLWVWALEGVRGLDAPHTCLPSLHITNCGLAVLALWGTRWGPWSLVWSLAIAASTLTTGQHLFLDLPAGAIPPIIGYAVARRLPVFCRPRDLTRGTGAGGAAAPPRANFQKEEARSSSVGRVPSRGVPRPEDAR